MFFSASRCRSIFSKQNAAINAGARRFFSAGNFHKKQNEKNKAVAYYTVTVVVMVFGLSYASVPLYKMFCQMTGFGGTTQRVDEAKSIDVKPVKGAKVIRVDFTSTVHSDMPWKFKPTQPSIKVVPGETALAFYTVTNTKPYPITGVATYNVSLSDTCMCMFTSIYCDRTL